MAESVVYCFGRLVAYCLRGFELEPEGGGMFFFKLVDGLAWRGPAVIGPFSEIVVSPSGI